MAANTIIDGSVLMAFIGTGSTKTPIIFSTAVKLDEKTDMNDRTNKGSVNSKEVYPGRDSWSVSSDAFYSIATGTTHTYTTLRAIRKNKLPVNVVLAHRTGTAPNFTVDATKPQLTGTGFISGLSLDASDGADAKFSVTIDGTGDLI